MRVRFHLAARPLGFRINQPALSDIQSSREIPRHSWCRLRFLAFVRLYEGICVSKCTASAHPMPPVDIGGSGSGSGPSHASPMWSDPRLAFLARCGQHFSLSPMWPHNPINPINPTMWGRTTSAPEPRPSQTSFYTPCESTEIDAV